MTDSNRNLSSASSSLPKWQQRESNTLGSDNLTSADAIDRMQRDESLLSLVKDCHFQRRSISICIGVQLFIGIQGCGTCRGFVRTDGVCKYGSRCYYQHYYRPLEANDLVLHETFKENVDAVTVVRLVDVITWRHLRERKILSSEDAVFISLIVPPLDCSEYFLSDEQLTPELTLSTISNETNKLKLPADFHLIRIWSLHAVTTLQIWDAGISKAREILFPPPDASGTPSAPSTPHPHARLAPFSSSASFLSLPPSALQHLSQYLCDASLAALSLTSRAHYALFADCSIWIPRLLSTPYWEAVLLSSRLNIAPDINAWTRPLDTGVYSPWAVEPVAVPKPAPTTPRTRPPTGSQHRKDQTASSVHALGPIATPPWSFHISSIHSPPPSLSSRSSLFASPTNSSQSTRSSVSSARSTLSQSSISSNASTTSTDASSPTIDFSTLPSRAYKHTRRRHPPEESTCPCLSTRYMSPPVTSTPATNPLLPPPLAPLYGQPPTAGGGGIGGGGGGGGTNSGSSGVAALPPPVPPPPVDPHDGRTLRTLYFQLQAPFQWAAALRWSRELTLLKEAGLPATLDTTLALHGYRRPIAPGRGAARYQQFREPNRSPARSSTSPLLQALCGQFPMPIRGARDNNPSNRGGGGGGGGSAFVSLPPGLSNSERTIAARLMSASLSPSNYTATLMSELNERGASTSASVSAFSLPSSQTQFSSRGGGVGQSLAPLSSAISDTAPAITSAIAPLTAPVGAPPPILPSVLSILQQESRASNKGGSPKSEGRGSRGKGKKKGKKGGKQDKGDKFGEGKGDAKGDEPRDVPASGKQKGSGAVAAPFSTPTTSASVAATSTSIATTTPTEPAPEPVPYSVQLVEKTLSLLFPSRVYVTPHPAQMSPELLPLPSLSDRDRDKDRNREKEKEIAASKKHAAWLQTLFRDAVAPGETGRAKAMVLRRIRRLFGGNGASQVPVLPSYMGYPTHAIQSYPPHLSHQPHQPSHPLARHIQYPASSDQYASTESTDEFSLDLSDFTSSTSSSTTPSEGEAEGDSHKSPGTESSASPDTLSQGLRSLRSLRSIDSYSSALLRTSPRISPLPAPLAAPFPAPFTAPVAPGGTPIGMSPSSTALARVQPSPLGRSIQPSPLTLASDTPGVDESRTATPPPTRLSIQIGTTTGSGGGGGADRSRTMAYGRLLSSRVLYSPVFTQSDSSPTSSRSSVSTTSTTSTASSRTSPASVSAHSAESHTTTQSRRSGMTAETEATQATEGTERTLGTTVQHQERSETSGEEPPSALRTSANGPLSPGTDASTPTSTASSPSSSSSSVQGSPNSEDRFLQGFTQAATDLFGEDTTEEDDDDDEHEDAEAESTARGGASHRRRRSFTVQRPQRSTDAPASALLSRRPPPPLTTEATASIDAPFQRPTPIATRARAPVASAPSGYRFHQHQHQHGQSSLSKPQANGGVKQKAKPDPPSLTLPATLTPLPPLPPFSSSLALASAAPSLVDIPESASSNLFSTFGTSGGAAGGAGGGSSGGGGGFAGAIAASSPRAQSPHPFSIVASAAAAEAFESASIEGTIGRRKRRPSLSSLPRQRKLSRDGINTDSPEFSATNATATTVASSATATPSAMAATASTPSAAAATPVATTGPATTSAYASSIPPAYTNAPSCTALPFSPPPPGLGVVTPLGIVRGGYTVGPSTSGLSNPIHSIAMDRSRMLVMDNTGSFRMYASGGQRLATGKSTGPGTYSGASASASASTSPPAITSELFDKCRGGVCSLGFQDMAIATGYSDGSVCLSSITAGHTIRPEAILRLDETLLAAANPSFASSTTTASTSSASTSLSPLVLAPSTAATPGTPGTPGTTATATRVRSGSTGSALSAPPGVAVAHTLASFVPESGGLLVGRRLLRPSLYLTQAGPLSLHAAHSGELIRLFVPTAPAPGTLELPGWLQPSPSALAHLSAAAAVVGYTSGVCRVWDVRVSRQVLLFAPGITSSGTGGGGIGGGVLESGLLDIAEARSTVHCIATSGNVIAEAREAGSLAPQHSPTGPAPLDATLQPLSNPFVRLWDARRTDRPFHTIDLGGHALHRITGMTLDPEKGLFVTHQHVARPYQDALELTNTQDRSLLLDALHPGSSFESDHHELLEQLEQARARDRERLGPDGTGETNPANELPRALRERFLDFGVSEDSDSWDEAFLPPVEEDPAALVRALPLPLSLAIGTTGSRNYSAQAPRAREFFRSAYTPASRSSISTALIPDYAWPVQHRPRKYKNKALSDFGGPSGRTALPTPGDSIWGLSMWHPHTFSHTGWVPLPSASCLAYERGMLAVGGTQGFQYWHTSPV